MAAGAVSEPNLSVFEDPDLRVFGVPVEDDELVGSSEHPQPQSGGILQSYLSLKIF